MLLSYTANIKEENNLWTGFIYGLPVRYSGDGLHDVLEGLSNELDSYLRIMLKKKAPFMMPYKQPMSDGDYDIPIQLDLAFVLILKVFKAKLPQKDLAQMLGKSAAYLSSVETLDTGVTLANANEMLRKLGINTAFTILPYRGDESGSYQYSPDKENIPMAASKHNFDNTLLASYDRPEKKNFYLPFPMIMRQISDNLFEITFPALEKYGLNITVVDETAEQTLKRAENAVNLALLGTDKKIEYPEIQQHHPVVGLWSETARKHFPKEPGYSAFLGMYDSPFKPDEVPVYWIIDSKDA